MSHRVLQAFDRALALETHHISRDPHLLLQQLHNRLQWEDADVLAALDSNGQARSGTRRAVIRLKTRQRESAALRTTIEAHGGPVAGCAIAPDGTYVVSVGADGVARQWDPRTGREIQSLRIAEPGSGGPVELRQGATCCAVSPTGAFIVAGGAGGTVKVWDPRSGTELWGVAESGFSISTCAALPDGHGVLWARADAMGRLSSDSVLRIRDRGGEDRTIELRGTVVSCAPSPDGALVALAASDGITGRLEMRNLRTGVPLWKGKHPPMVTTEIEGKEAGLEPPISDCAFAPDAAFAVTAAQDSTLRAWNARSGTCTKVLRPPATFRIDVVVTSEHRQAKRVVTDQTACTVTADGAHILSGTAGGAMNLWDVSSGRLIATLEGHGDEVTACAVSPDARLAASASLDGTVRIWDLAEAGGGRDG